MSAGPQREPATPERRALGWAVALVLLGVALWAPNARDGFLGDDFDLIGSFWNRPAGYFAALLWSNESGEAWKEWGIDPALGRGYLRPLKIWLLRLDYGLWGTSAAGYHATSLLCFLACLLGVFAILRIAAPRRPAIAFLGAALLAVHPICAEILPFVTAREELMAGGFGLLAVCCFLLQRRAAGGALGFPLFFALALLTKESAVGVLALPLGYDLVNGRARPWTREGRAEALAVYAAPAALVAAYLGLRWIAFGNLAGGDGTPTHYLSPAHFAAFHLRYLASLFDPTLFAGARIPSAGGAAFAIVALAAAWALARGELSSQRLRDLVFFGPVWYLGTTAVLYGTVFATRHHLLPWAGIAIFLALLLDSLLGERRGALEAAAVAAALAAAALAFLPPTLATQREFRIAARAVDSLRSRIEERAAALPDGSAIALRGVPQWRLPPFFFGWGLRAALSPPFARDLGSRCFYNHRNLLLTRSAAPFPESPDFTLSFDTSWLPRWMAERQLARLAREGLSADREMQFD